MRKLFFITALSALLLPLELFSQLVGGSDNRVINTPKGPDKENQGSIHGMLKNRFFLSYSLCRPYGIWSDEREFTSIAPGLQGYDGMGYSGGFALDLGTMLYFHSLEINEKFRLGVDWSILDFALLRTDDTEDNTFFLGTRLGPLATYQLADKVLLDASFTLAPCIGFGNEYDMDLLIRRNISIQARYNKFLLGFQLDFSKFSAENELYDEFGSYVTNVNFRPNFMKFRIGFAF